MDRLETEKKDDWKYECDTSAITSVFCLIEVGRCRSSLGRNEASSRQIFFSVESCGVRDGELATNGQQPVEGIPKSYMHTSLARQQQDCTLQVRLRLRLRLRLHVRLQLSAFC